MSKTLTVILEINDGQSFGTLRTMK